MNIVAVSAEVAPWSKVGGLADVVDALPVALAARGHRVMTVSGRYKPYEDAWDTGLELNFHLFGEDHRLRVFHGKTRGVDRVFIDHPAIRRGGVYGDTGGSYADNQLRFALLCRAAIESARWLALDGEPYGEDVAFWTNDWHGGLLPVYLRALYRNVGLFTRAPVLLGLHNLAHQGVFPASTADGLDLPRRWYPTLDMDGAVNTMKAGLVTAERVVTVSPTYAEEIRTPEGGWGLDGLLRARAADVRGVLNGIDTEDWDPATDRHIAAPFSVDDLSGKALCKAALQRELGLPVREDVPLLGFVGRLDPQKGMDLIRDAFHWLMAQGVQIVLLGSGSAALEGFLREIERVWPQQARGWVGFSTPVAHRIIAGSDLLLMPSRFEPCGLSQLHALRYGTPPVVRATGGLKDTVQPYDPSQESGNGWSFVDPSGEALAQALRWALITWRDYPGSFREIQRRGMTQDLSWDRAAAAYEALFQEAADQLRG